MPPQEVIDQATDFFLRYGLRIQQKGPDRLALSGGGGTIAIQAGYVSTDSDVTEVDLFTTEWQHPARRFMARISGSPPAPAGPTILAASPGLSVALIMSALALIVVGLMFV